MNYDIEEVDGFDPPNVTRPYSLSEVKSSQS